MHQHSSSPVPVILCGCQSDQRFTEIPAMFTLSTTDSKRRPVFSEEVNTNREIKLDNQVVKVLLVYFN